VEPEDAQPALHALPDDGGLAERAWIAAALIDPRAFAPIYQHYFPLIHAYCRRRLRNTEHANDATSQIFINAIQALPRFRQDPKRPGSSFRSWLFSIAHNVVIDHYRRARPHLSLDATSPRNDDDTANLPILIDDDPTPEERAIASESRSELGDLLRQLPERQRAVAELRLAGLTNAEIAETLGITYPAVRSAQYRAFLLLRELIASQPSHSHSPENVR
jgi:RNA polymerase sigma-70 factor (ECF subfamily)